MKNFKSISSWLLAGMVFIDLGHAVCAEETVAWKLSSQAEVDSAGIFLDQIVTTPTSTVALPHLRLAPAPSPGQTASLSRNQICELVQKQTAGFVSTNWSGATQ